VPQVEGQDSWRTYLDLLLRWWWLIVLCALLAAGIAALVSYSQTAIYQTSTKLLINQASSANSAVQDMQTSGRLAQTYAQWMSQKIVIERTMAQLGLPNDPKLIDQQITSLTATPDGDSQIIQLTVQGPNRDFIVAFARTLPQVFSQWAEEVQTSRYAETKTSLSSRMDDLNKQIETTQNSLDLIGDTRDLQQQAEYNRLQEELSRLRTSYNNLAETYEQLLLTEAQSVDTIATIEDATPPGAPIQPRPLRNIALALVMGAMIAVGLVYLYELYIDRFRSSDEIRQTLATPILGTINQLDTLEGHSHKTLVAITAPRSLAVESFRRLRTNLRFADVDHELHTLAITSANPNEGKSVIAANLAVVMAQAGLTVVLIDGDMRKSKMHRIFETSRSPGLSDLLYNESFDGLDLVLQATEEPNLRILTVGRKAPNPAELLGSQRMKDLLAKLREHADLVIIDTPPILAVSDSQIVGTEVDGTLMVIDSKRTTRKMTRLAVEALDQVGARIVGVAVNRVESKARGYYYYDNYEYYEDDEGDDADDGSGGTKAKRKGAGWWTRRPQPVAKLREQQVYATRANPE